LPSTRRTGRLDNGIGERRPDGVAVDAEGLGEVGDGDDDTAAQPDALEVAAADELVGRGATYAEDLAGLLDGEGMVMAHAWVGREAPRIPRINPCRPGSPVREVHHRG
jgi:hypothetical protein